MPDQPVGLLKALTDSMHWHEARQRLLAQNVANADTPNYRGMDLEPFSVSESGSVRLAPVADQPGFLPLSAGGDAGFAAQSATGFKTRPEEAGVTIEDEMTKVTGNAMDYAAVTSLYNKTLQLLRTAFRGSGT